jgi:hypothetical protein
MIGGVRELSPLCIEITDLRKILSPRREMLNNLFPMKGLFWNCRGTRKKGLDQYVWDLFDENKLDFVCFQETITQDFSEECFRKLDPNKNIMGLDPCKR